MIVAFQQRPPGNVCGCVGMCYVYAICVWHMCPCVLSHTNLRNGNGVYSWRSVLGASNTEYMVEDSSPDSLLVGLPLTLIHWRLSCPSPITPVEKRFPEQRHVRYEAVTWFVLVRVAHMVVAAGMKRKEWIRVKWRSTGFGNKLDIGRKRGYHWEAGRVRMTLSSMVRGEDTV